MGRLLSQTQLNLTANWYFSDAYYSTDSRGGYVYQWPSNDFPYCHHIHYDHLDNEKRTKIRKWIENIISDTVIYDYLELNYRRYYGRSRDWDAGRDVSNKWMRFFFEDKNSSLMFKIAFSELIKEPTRYHPDCPDDEKWCNIEAGEKQ